MITLLELEVTVKDPEVLETSGLRLEARTSDGTAATVGQPTASTSGLTWPGQALTAPCHAAAVGSWGEVELRLSSAGITRAKAVVWLEDLDREGKASQPPLFPSQ